MESFSVNQFAAFSKLSPEYIRQACRRQKDSYGRIAKLPKGWACAKERGEWRIFLRKDIDERPYRQYLAAQWHQRACSVEGSEVPNFASPAVYPWRHIEEYVFSVDEDGEDGVSISLDVLVPKPPEALCFESLLRTCELWYQFSALNNRSFELKLTFTPDGRLKLILPADFAEPFLLADLLHGDLLDALMEWVLDLKEKVERGKRDEDSGPLCPACGKKSKMKFCNAACAKRYARWMLHLARARTEERGRLLARKLWKLHDTHYRAGLQIEFEKSRSRK